MAVGTVVADAEVGLVFFADLRLIYQLGCNCPEYSEAYRLRKFLAYFVPLQDKELPPTSLLREFLGGSSFRY